MYKIDNLDIKIVDLLMKDGRMACSEIARRIGGVTERAIRYRLERLVENRIIAITAVVKCQLCSLLNWRDGCQRSGNR